MNYVISLKDADERRLHISNEFEKHNLNFKFFDAITVKEVDAYAKKFDIKFDDNMLTQVEKACFLSHIVICENFLKSNLEYIAVFEDDVILGIHSNHFLADFSWTPSNIDFIKIEKFEKNAFMSLKTINIGYCRFLRLLKGKHLGAAGYILSRNAAQIILNSVYGKFINKPIDVIIFEDKILSKEYKIYQMVPSLVIQAGRLSKGALPSQLQGERCTRKIVVPKEKINIQLKLKRELFRVIKNIWKLFCKVKFN